MPNWKEKIQDRYAGKVTIVSTNACFDGNLVSFTIEHIGTRKLANTISQWISFYDANERVVWTQFVGGEI